MRILQVKKKYLILLLKKEFKYYRIKLLKFKI